MELTLDEALQKGVEAHKAGQLQEADRYYTAILKVQPKHPDANHNMGVLAVGVGKVQEALPFFKTALEVNSNIPQFWLSHIDALIKLDRTDEAKAVFDQAKSQGVQGDGFDQIEKRLGSSASKKSSTQEPSQEQLQSLINLYTQGQYQETLTQAAQVLKEFPNSINLYNIIGSANQSLGNLEKAVEDFKKAVSINPDFSEAYNNMGTTLKNQDKLEEAITAYEKAISLRPNYAQAFYNLGIILLDLNKLKEAEIYTLKAIEINPNFADFYYNLGAIYQKHQKLEESITAYEKALSLDPYNSAARADISASFNLPRSFRILAILDLDCTELGSS